MQIPDISPDTPMAIRHLWLGYAAVWIIQFGYAILLAVKWSRVSKPNQR